MALALWIVQKPHPYHVCSIHSPQLLLFWGHNDQNVNPISIGIVRSHPLEGDADQRSACPPGRS